MPIELPRPGLLPQAQDLYAALIGQMPSRVPRQELFFHNPAIARHFVGRDALAEDFRHGVELAREIGWGMARVASWGVGIGYPVCLEMGLAAAHGVETQANDLGDIKRRFGDRLTLFGNFDPVVLATDRPERIRQMAREMVEAGKPGGRYVAAVNTIVGENVPLENYLAFIEGVDEAAGY